MNVFENQSENIKYKIATSIDDLHDVYEALANHKSVLLEVNMIEEELKNKFFRQLNNIVKIGNLHFEQVRENIYTLEPNGKSVK